MEAIQCVLGTECELLRVGIASLFAQSDIAVIGDAATVGGVLKLVADLRPDVVVLDQALRDGDGTGVCQQLVDRGHATKVVLLSDRDRPAAVQHSLEAGASAYVLKTSPALDLMRAVRVANAGRKFVDAELVGCLVDHGQTRPRLSRREHEVIQLLSDGITTDGIGEHLFLSPATIRTYIESAMGKLDARNRVHVVALGLREGLLE